MSGVAVAVCPCVAGFFRAAQENPSVGCTRKSNAVNTAIFTLKIKANSESGLLVHPPIFTHNAAHAVMLVRCCD